MSMVKKSITITEQQEQWIQAQLASGQYASDSEIMREALREKALRSAELEELRARLIAAEEAGFSDKTPEQIRQAAKAKLKSDGQL